MGGKFLLMTATLPDFVKKELIRKGISFGKINIYEDEKNRFQKFYKHKVKIMVVGENQGKNYDGVAGEVLQKANSGKRVLVIFNTVKKAQEFYEKLKNKLEEKKGEYGNIDESKIFLFHSRFTIKDREDKESKISQEFGNPKPKSEKEGKILVATQVVEASLDIDADILYTEICPLDALVQRMGRVARRYFYENGKVIDKSEAIPEHNLNADVFKAWEKYNDNEPNVYILVDDEEIESGGGRVYETELIKLSLAWLWKFKEPKDISFLEDYADTEKDWNEIEKEIDKFFEKHFGGFIPNEEEKGPESNKKKGRKKKEKKEDKGKVSIYGEIVEQNRKDWMKKFGDKIKDLELELSEYDKYRIVSLFYWSLKPEGSYLKEFYQTLDLLDAGYMSEKKAEAQRIFREIYDVNIIPIFVEGGDEKELEKMARTLVDLVDKRKTDFKDEFVKNYVVSVPLWNVINHLTEERKVYKRLERFLEESLKNFSDTNEKEKKKRKLRGWLEGIWILKVPYCSEKGIILSKELLEKYEWEGENLL